MTTPIHVVVSSAELAKVKELPPAIRRFEVGSDDGMTTTVTYTPFSDKLFCQRHHEYDNCACCARVRLCGVITNTVVPDVKQYRRTKP